MFPVGHRLAGENDGGALAHREAGVSPAQGFHHTFPKVNCSGFGKRWPRRRGLRFSRSGVGRDGSSATAVKPLRWPPQTRLLRLSTTK